MSLPAGEPHPEVSPARFALFGSALEISLVGAAWIVRWTWPDGFLPIEWTPTAVAAGTLGVLPPLGALLLLSSKPVRRLRAVERVFGVLREHVGETLAGLELGHIVIISAAAGFGEEVLFRGALQPRMGILLSGLLFGLLHPFTLLYTAFAAVFGLYLGLLADRAGLLAAILTHAIYDAIALVLVRAEMRKPAES